MRSPGRASSRQLGLVAVAALAGAALWGPASPASAEPGSSPEAGGTVSFNGGCGLLGSGLGARSTPDAAQLSVPAGGEVIFANRLGQPAMLRLDGEAAANVAPGDTVEVVFERGPVMATMQISCLLGAPAGAVAVEVVPAPEAPRAQPDPPTTAPATGTGSRPSGGSRTSGTSAGGATSSGPSRAGGGSSSAGTPSQGGTETAPGGYAPDGAVPGAWWIDEPGDAGAAGDPDVARPDRTPGRPRSAGDDRRSDQAGGGGQPVDPATVEEQPAEDGLATEQLSRTAETSDEGPVGLLALLAVVCAVGVSAGAARTLIAQRAQVRRLPA